MTVTTLRTMRTTRLALIAMTLCGLVCGRATADDAGQTGAAYAPYELGGRIDPLSLETQHGESGGIDAATKQVLFTRDMDAGKVVKAALAEGGRDLLERSGTVYVADVSAMPALIRRLFALPGLRRREYAMSLDTDGQTTSRIPRQPGKPTLIKLDALEIIGFEYPADADAVRAALTTAAPSH